VTAQARSSHPLHGLAASAPEPPVATARVVLFGDGTWAAETLRRLVQDGHEVVAVVLRARPSNASLADVAREAGVPTLQFQKADTPETREAVAALAPDILLSVAFNEILRAPMLRTARLGSLNVHAGRLPQYRGRNVINWALINGESQIGVTAHLMDEGIDTGDILVQRLLPVGWTDGYGDVLARVIALVPDVAAEAVRMLVRGEATPLPQVHEQSTYFGGRGPDDEWLDWSASSRVLHNKVRAITRPGPGARTLLGRTPIVVWRARWEPDWPRYIATPGQIVGRHPEGVLVKTGDSTLLLQEVQMPGQPPGPPPWPVGTRLGLDPLSTIVSLVERVHALEARLP
jgi:methionyl-tRNA formyltransferase